MNSLKVGGEQELIKRNLMGIVDKRDLIQDWILETDVDSASIPQICQTCEYEYIYINTLIYIYYIEYTVFTPCYVLWKLKNKK